MDIKRNFTLTPSALFTLISWTNFPELWKGRPSVIPWEIHSTFLQWPWLIRQLIIFLLCELCYWLEVSAMPAATDKHAEKTPKQSRQKISSKRYFNPTAICFVNKIITITFQRPLNNCKGSKRGLNEEIIWTLLTLVRWKVQQVCVKQCRVIRNTSTISLILFRLLHIF